MAPHSSTLAWEIPWIEEPGGLQSMGLQRVGHDWETSLSLLTFMRWRRHGNPLQCSGLENPRDGGAWWAAIYGVAQSWTWLMRLSSSSSSILSNSDSPFFSLGFLIHCWAALLFFNLAHTVTTSGWSVLLCFSINQSEKIRCSLETGSPAALTCHVLGLQAMHMEVFLFFKFWMLWDFFPWSF